MEWIVVFWMHPVPPWQVWLLGKISLLKPDAMFRMGCDIIREWAVSKNLTQVAVNSPRFIQW